MPQPIRRPCAVQLDGLGSLPAHAEQLGQIVSCSGALEAMLGHLLAYLTNGSASVTIPMFHAVSSTDAQRAMLTAAAEQMLQGAELDEFRDLISEFRTRYGERSRLVHNLWGVSPQHPNKAVWCPAKDATRISSKIAGMHDPEQLNIMFQTDESAALWRCCSLYTVDDINAVWRRLALYTDEVPNFILKLQAQHPAFGLPPPVPEPTDAQDSLPHRDLSQD